MSARSQLSTDLFYFGGADRQLFGALHAAQTYAQREHGVVICYPFGNEYIRSHRACHHLATQLARTGFPALRFDYGGAGDSAGEDDDVSLARCRDDIASAIDALRDRAGVESVCLAGVRLGASLALETAVKRPDVSGLILWEPIITGGGYLVELSEQHQELLWRFFDQANRLVPGSFSEALGFPLGATLRGELSRLNLLTLPPAQTGHVLIVESQAVSESARLYEHLRDGGLNVTFQRILSFAAWGEDVDKGLVPDNVLRGITAWAAQDLS